VTAILGGLHSSTATTVVLARRASTGEIPLARAQVGIALATAVMYLRILAIIAQSRQRSLIVSGDQPGTGLPTRKKE
jgi:uncharacterized membrane protein (DUF4010 family)